MRSGYAAMLALDTPGPLSSTQGAGQAGGDVSKCRDVGVNSVVLQRLDLHISGIRP